MSFIGKVVLITGASSGIGAACAEYYAKEGALLALVGRNAEKFDRVIEKIKENGIDEEPLVILADVTTEAERIISETIEKYEHLDILINNAGVLIRGSFETMQLDDFDLMMATNIRSAVELTKLAMPYLIVTKGNIANVSSAAGLIAAENAIAYSMTKAAMNHFTKCLAIGYAEQGVRVNAICPGYIVDTDLYGDDRESAELVGAAEYMAKAHPLQRNGSTEDCVNAIAFVTKDSASFVTGIFLRVDGGLSTKGVI